MSAAADHGRQWRSNFTRKPLARDEFLANTITYRGKDPAGYQGFLDSSQTTTYQARTRALATTFSPHTLVRTAHRLHFRGYSLFEDAGRGYYWNLVPSRLLSARPVRADYVDASGDEAWHRQVTLHLALQDHVPPPIKAALQREHGMLTDRLEIGPLPQALLHYVRDEYLGRRYEGYGDRLWRSSTSPDTQGVPPEYDIGDLHPIEVRREEPTVAE